MRKSKRKKKKNKNKPKKKPDQYLDADKRISAILYRYDPVKVGEGAPEDEYDVEAHDIRKKMIEDPRMTQEDVALLCSRTFDLYFTGGASYDIYGNVVEKYPPSWGTFKSEDFLDIAKEIMVVMQEEKEKDS